MPIASVVSGKLTKEKDILIKQDITVNKIQLKNHSRIILKASGVALTIGLLTFCGLFLWLTLRKDNVIEKQTFSQLVKQIKSSEKLPDRFYVIYGRVSGFNQNSTTTRYLFHKATGLFYFESEGARKNPCPCIQASYPVVRETVDTWSVGLALEKQVSPTECLDFYLEKMYFQKNIHGIRQASRFFYHKEIEQLTDEQLLELCVMTSNPYYFDKLRQPKHLRNAVDRMNKEIKE